MNEKTRPVTIIDPPHNNRASRILSVLGSLRVNHRPATNPISAAGINQEISVPNEVPNIRPIPAAPPKPPPPIPPPGPPAAAAAAPPAPPGRAPPAPPGRAPPTLPEPPKMRLRPLYPIANSHNELV